MPREHTSAITQKGTLKLEVRTAHVIYHSDIWSSLFLRILMSHTPKLLLFVSGTSLCCHSEVSLKTELRYNSFWVYTTDT